MSSTVSPTVSLSEIVAIRHDLHAHPQLAYEETYACETVQRELTKAGIQFKAGLAGGTGVLGYLPATSNPDGAPTIALRADMDALPIHEETGVAYASQTPGKMHACGHDGHTSILIGAAHALAATAHRQNNVLFVFQPAEEGGAGGKRMVEDGCLSGRVLGKKADFMFGLHGWTTVQLGRVETRIGSLMAATDEFFITVHGQGGHAAAPNTTIDPIVISAHIVTALQSVVARNTDPFDSVVVTVGEIHAGTAHNVIPMTATLHGTIRTLTPESRKSSVEAVRRLAERIAEGFGARTEFVHNEGYPVTSNHEDAVARFMKVATQVVGAENVSDNAYPTMGGEDFSYYGAECPSCFYQLGLIPHGQSSYPSVHTPHFNFNDDAIEVGMKVMVALALSE